VREVATVRELQRQELVPGRGEREVDREVGRRPEYGWTLAWSTPNSSVARATASCSIGSNELLALVVALGRVPLEYLLVSTEPVASSTAADT